MASLPHHLRLAGFVGLIGLAGTLPGLAQEHDAPPDDIPDWAVEDMARMVGRWVADNAAYRSDDEPFDAYGTEWAWSLGEKSLTGRLFGLRDGEEAGTFWEFRQYWHPGLQQLMLYQFGGDGTVGVGAHEHISTDTSRTVQTFYRPDGTSYRVGHLTVYRDDAHEGRSFAVDDEDVWTPRRTYVWHRTGER